MQIYTITLPLDKCLDLNKLWEELKKYEGRELEDTFLLSKKDTLLNLHIGAVNSHRIGYHPLVINYHARNHSYIVGFSDIKVTLDTNKIICEGVMTRNGNKVVYEYNFF